MLGVRPGSAAARVRSRPATAVGAAVAFGVVALLTAIFGAGLAAPGDLDPQFGTGGRATTALTNLDDQIFGLAIQRNGRIVAGGRTFGGVGGRDFALARYRSDGTLDAAFGTGGIVTTDFAGDLDDAFGVALQKDQKILLAGQRRSGGDFDFAMARYRRDGTLDPAFGNGGKVTTDFGGEVDDAEALAVQKDGRVVLAGGSDAAGQFDFALARYNRNGTPDASFGTGGMLLTDFGGPGDFALALAIQSDGKIVAGGEVFVGGLEDFALARYQRNGRLDTSFGSGGKVTTDFDGGDDSIRAVLVQKDGKIVAIGPVFAFGLYQFGLARFNADGSLDSSFGTEGKVTTSFTGLLDRPAAAVLQKDGRIVVAGSTGFMESLNFAVARYNRDGTLDAEFGVGGKMTTDFDGMLDEANAVAIQRDGRIVAAGEAVVGGSRDFALARYLRR